MAVWKRCVAAHQEFGINNSKQCSLGKRKKKLLDLTGRGSSRVLAPYDTCSGIAGSFVLSVLFILPPASYTVSFCPHSPPTASTLM